MMMQYARSTIGGFGTVLGTALLVLGVPGCSGDGGSGGNGTGGGGGDAVADADGTATGGEDSGSGTDDTGGTDEDTGGSGGGDADTGATGGMDTDTGGGGGGDADSGVAPGADADATAPSDTNRGSETGTDTSGGSDTGPAADFRVVNCASVTPAANVQVGPFRSYQPGEVTVSSGEVVRWNWASSVTLRHNVTAAENQSCSSSKPARFQSQTTAAAGKTFCVEFNRTGKWNYHCSVSMHCSKGMKGRVIVN